MGETRGRPLLTVHLPIDMGLFVEIQQAFT